MLALDLQGTWGDVAGWTPYHDIVIHHDISLWIFFSFWLLINTFKKKSDKAAVLTEMINEESCICEAHLLSKNIWC